MFSISGFLISASYENTVNIKEFLKKRARRILPGYYVNALVILGMILILALPDVNVKDIVKWGITQVVCLGQTPGTLKNFATGSLNGGLWSIIVELQLYVITVFIYKWVKKSKLNSLLIIIIFATFNLLYEYLPMPYSIKQVLSRSFLPFGLWYMIGMVMYIYKDELIPKIKEYVWIIFCSFIAYRVVILYFNIGVIGYYSDIITSFMLPILSVSMAFEIKPIRFKQDFSYGIYLYHWCVLNLLVHFEMFKYLSGFTNLVVFVLGTLALAILSWFGIEKKFVRRKA